MNSRFRGNDEAEVCLSLNGNRSNYLDFHMKTVLILLTAFFFVNGANACVTEILDIGNVNIMLPGKFSFADTVVHGKVISVDKKIYSSHGNDFYDTAEIKVLESFKGDNNGKTITVSGSHDKLISKCDYWFTPGEEEIYFIKNGEVSMGGVEHASEWLVAALRAISSPKAAPDKTQKPTR